MRDEKQETIEDIVAEMREFADHRDFDSYGNMNVANLRFFVYRIEAAWKREREREQAKSRFVYAIQIYQGRWRIFEDGFSSHDETKERINEMSQILPRAEFRIVRHPAMLGVCWEVVE